jgi:hypothetical protein
MRETVPSAASGRKEARMYKRIVAVVLSAMLLVAVSGPTLAPAAKIFKTKVTITQGDNSNFHGKVKSRKRACKKGRKVTLQRKTTYQSTFHSIGFDRSNKRGKWKVNTTPVSQASYRAKVKKKRLRHHRGICERARSRVIVAP